jgi:hypothetical protein
MWYADFRRKITAILGYGHGGAGIDRGRDLWRGTVPRLRRAADWPIL